ncbi:MAG: uroporphyrinogen-III synthase [Bacteroidota bacterium]
MTSSKNKVFISRELAKESPFRTALEAADFEVLGESLIAFEQLTYDAIPDSDWVFFYSKNAVQFFIEGLAALSDLIQLAAMGPGTAAVLEDYGLEPDFVGSGKPEAVATAFAERAAGQRVLFPRAKQSRKSVQQLLDGTIEALDLPVYDNKIREDLDLPHCQHLVFTSPMNAEAYFGKYVWREGQAVYAIGDTTATALRALGLERVQVAPQAGEAVLAQLILSQP